VGVFRREEDPADKWLRDHDPYYTDPDKGKRGKLDCPYDTPKQEYRKNRVEIPISNLSSSQRLSVAPILGTFKEIDDVSL
jgi:hypothetical protein